MALLGVEDSAGEAISKGSGVNWSGVDGSRVDGVGDLSGVCGVGDLSGKGC